MSERQSETEIGKMSDWKHEIRQRVAELKLEPSREFEIVEELEQHRMSGSD